MTTGRSPSRISLSALGLVLLAPWMPGTVRAAEDGGVQGPFAHGVGNRALAMGSAFTAVAADATAAVWNPGGLGLLARRELLVSQASLFGIDASEQYLAFGWPSWRWGATAFTVRRIGVSGIERRDDRNVQLGTFDDQELEFSLAYARAVNDAWSLGGTVKLRRQEIAEYSANGFGLDLGVHVKPALAAGVDAAWASRLAAGLALRNVVAPSLRLDRDPVTEPVALVAGLAWSQPVLANGHVVLATDFEKAQDVDAKIRAGLEVTPHPLLALRGGWNGNEATAGAGIRWKMVSFDYAFENVELDAIHRFGVTLGFGATTAEARLATQQREDEEFRLRLAETFERRQAERVDELLARARHLLDEGRIDEALEAVATVRALSPQDTRTAQLEARALAAQAAAEEEAERFAEATILYGRVLGIHPDDVQAQDGIVRCRMESNLRAERTSRIRTLFGEALDAFTTGDLLTAHSNLSDILSLAPDDDEARAMLARTETAISSRSAALRDQAGRSLDRGLLDEAGEQLAQARVLDPESSDLAALELRLRDAERALQEAARRQQLAAERASLEPEPIVVKAPTLSRKKRREIADLYRRGMEALDEERADDALRYWELVWLADPTYENVSEYLKREYLLRGLEEFSRGGLDEAIRLWEKARTVDPNDEKTLGYLERAREQQTRTREILGR